MVNDFNSIDRDIEISVRTVTHFIIDFVVILVMALFVTVYVGDIFVVSGHSMEPVYKEGDSILINRVSYAVMNPSRYDVIAFSKDDDEDHIYIKRVIALPGETIQIQNRKIFIDDKELDCDEYIDNITLAGVAAAPVTLKKGEFFVLGDKTESSEDSRFSNIGNVNKNEIIGRVWFKLFPLSRMGFAK